MAAGQANFTDFVDMNKTAMSVALGGLAMTSTAKIVVVYQGNSISFGYKVPDS